MHVTSMCDVDWHNGVELGRFRQYVRVCVQQYHIVLEYVVVWCNEICHVIEGGEGCLDIHHYCH